jgi:hypothetical protein
VARLGWKISPSTSTLSNVLFDHCRVRGVDVGLHCLASNVTVQYCTIQDINPDNSIDHQDAMYCYPSPNMIWRYNSIINCTADGLFFEYGGAVNFCFYGNLYYGTINHLIAFKAPDSYGLSERRQRRLCLRRLQHLSSVHLRLDQLLG